MGWFWNGFRVVLGRLQGGPEVQNRNQTPCFNTKKPKCLSIFTLFPTRNPTQQRSTTARWRRGIPDEDTCTVLLLCTRQVRPFLEDGPRDLDKATGPAENPIRHPSGLRTPIPAGEGHTTRVGDPASWRPRQPPAWKPPHPEKKRHCAPPHVEQRAVRRAPRGAANTRRGVRSSEPPSNAALLHLDLGEFEVALAAAADLRPPPAPGWRKRHAHSKE